MSSFQGISTRAKTNGTKRRRLVFRVDSESNKSTTQWQLFVLAVFKLLGNYTRWIHAVRWFMRDLIVYHLYPLSVLLDLTLQKGVTRANTRDTGQGVKCGHFTAAGRLSTRDGTNLSSRPFCLCALPIDKPQSSFLTCDTAQARPGAAQPTPGVHQQGRTHP